MILLLGALACARPLIDVPLGNGAAESVARGLSVAERTEIPEASIRAIIVPHHLTATEAMATGVHALKGEPRPLLVILGPDHHKRCHALLCTTDEDFRTFGGTVETPDSRVWRLAVSNLVEIDDALFAKEHAIGALLPYIAAELPGVPIIPLVVSGTRPWRGQEDEIADLLEPLLGRGATLVVSSDFSHRQSAAGADRWDERTVRTFFAGDLDGIARLENPTQSDCPACLWVLGALAIHRGFFNPSVLVHSNSARILGDLSQGNSTSHFAMAFYENAELGEADLAIGGDVTFTRGVLEPSEDLRSVWWGTGPRWLNLEGPIAEACPDRANPYLFCNPLARIPLELATHWTTVNNHMWDMGQEGHEQTLRALSLKGEIPVDGASREGLRLHALTRVMNPVDGVQQRGEDLWEILRSGDPSGLDVMMVHGGVEGQALVGEDLRRLGRDLVDAGAEAVVFVHSHVLADMEVYRGRPIYHGLGNLLFDQPDAVETSTARIVRLRREGDRVLFASELAR